MMTTTSIDRLGQAELMQGAMQAMTRADDAAALLFLNEAAARDDASAQTHFLLGASHAQLRQYDAAIAAFEASLTRDPDLAIARFQLGLLLLTCELPARASEILRPLSELGEDNALACFGEGLIHLIQDQFSDAQRCLLRGLALNSENPALNADMQKILDKIQPLVGRADDDDIADNRVTPSAQHVLISAYTNGRET
jgi:tetratricopeptide (TPR) repeat protein